MKVNNNISNEILQSTQHPDYRTEIIEVLRSSLTPKIKQERILAYHERDIASALEMLSLEERERLYYILNAETLADIFEYSENKTKYMNEIIIQKRIAILSQFEITEMAAYHDNISTIYVLDEKEIFLGAIIIV